MLTQKSEGDTLKLDVWRNKEKIELKTTMKVCDHIVKIQEYDMPSSYYVFGGLVFINLTQPYLHTWGEEWFNYAPRYLVTEAMKGKYIIFCVYSLFFYVMFCFFW